MAINSLDGIKPGDLFTTDGQEVWKVLHQSHAPTICLINVVSGERAKGAVGCRNLQAFRKLIPEGDPSSDPDFEVKETPGTVGWLKDILKTKSDDMPIVAVMGAGGPARCFKVERTACGEVCIFVGDTILAEDKSDA